MSVARFASKTEKPAKVTSARGERFKAAWGRYIDSMKYALHVITHPFDGFWDLIHEKRGTMAAADRLYGVTMQEKGVSALVSVNLIERELDA